MTLRLLGHINHDRLATMLIKGPVHWQYVPHVTSTARVTMKERMMHINLSQRTSLGHNQLLTNADS